MRHRGGPAGVAGEVAHGIGNEQLDVPFGFGGAMDCGADFHFGAVRPQRVHADLEQALLGVLEVDLPPKRAEGVIDASANAALLAKIDPSSTLVASSIAKGE